MVKQASGFPKKLKKVHTHLALHSGPSYWWRKGGGFGQWGYASSNLQGGTTGSRQPAVRATRALKMNPEDAEDREINTIRCYAQHLKAVLPSNTFHIACTNFDTKASIIQGSMDDITAGLNGSQGRQPFTCIIKYLLKFFLLCSTCKVRYQMLAVTGSVCLYFIVTETNHYPTFNSITPPPLPLWIFREADLQLSVGVSQDGAGWWLRHPVTHNGWAEHPGQVILVHLALRTPHHPQTLRSKKNIIYFGDLFILH